MSMYCAVFFVNPNNQGGGDWTVKLWPNTSRKQLWRGRRRVNNGRSSLWGEPACAAGVRGRDLALAGVQVGIPIPRWRRGGFSGGHRGLRNIGISLRMGKMGFPGLKLLSMIKSRICFCSLAFCSNRIAAGSPRKTSSRRPKVQWSAPAAPSPTLARAGRTLVCVHAQPSRGVLWVPRARPFRSFAAGLLVPRHRQCRPACRSGQPLTQCLAGHGFPSRAGRAIRGERVAGRAVIHDASSPPRCPSPRRVQQAGAGYVQRTPLCARGGLLQIRMRLGPWSGAELSSCSAGDLSTCLTPRGPLRRMAWATDVGQASHHRRRA